MKIGIDARMYSSAFTGIGRYVAELIAGLAQQDEQNEYVLFMRPEQAANFRLPARNFRVVAVTASHYSLAEQTSFLAALWRERLDLMHFTHFNTPLLYTGRTVVTIHDLTLHRYGGRKLVSPLHRLAYHAVLRRAVSHAERILTVSRHTAHDLVSLLGTPSAKITTVYNGVGPEFRPTKNRKTLQAKLARKYKLTGDFLLYTGVWREHKNLPGLLRAVALLRSKYGWQGQLVITGRDDPLYGPELKALIQTLGLTNTIRFVGLVPERDLIALYQTARVFVFPSFYEGFGLPLLEAMACGTVVACSRTSSLPEVAGRGGAVFFDPAQPSDMARQIHRAWSDAVLRRRLATQGIRRAQQFRWETLASETLAAYRKAVK
jgi:glycosyltransferase involved in cell wall biosynthesis